MTAKRNQRQNFGKRNLESPPPTIRRLGVGMRNEARTPPPRDNNPEAAANPPTPRTRESASDMTHRDMLLALRRDGVLGQLDYEDTMRRCGFLDWCPLQPPPVGGRRMRGRASRCTEHLAWFDSMELARDARDAGLIPHGRNLSGAWKHRGGGQAVCVKSRCAEHENCQVELHLKLHEASGRIQARTM